MDFNSANFKDQYFDDYTSESLDSEPVRAAMMKSLRCSPLIEWLHQVTVTLPHSMSRPG